MKNPLHTIIVLFLVLMNYSRISAQGTGQVPHIDNPDADTVYYCGIPVAVAPGIVIQNFNIDKPTDGIKISIINYVPEEDRLYYTGDVFDSQWNSELGNLEITGRGTAGELEEAVAQVYYENISESPLSAYRSISISLLDADYLPESGHFYRYVAQSDITWNEARLAAADTSYFGLQGYLATITTPVENDFIWTKIDGIGWIGATDEDQEGTWKWETGPEGLDGGTVFWQGDASGQPVDSLYSNWSEGEPNDNYGEDYAHINLDPNKDDKTWNDLPDAGGGGVYRSQGYIVEFGGMPGDPDIKLSASAVIRIHPLPDKPTIEYSSFMCGEKAQQVHINIDADVLSVLYPLDSTVSVYQETSISPVVEVQDYGRYSFVLQTYYQEQCSRYDTIEIAFQHQPVARINVGEEECIDPESQISFSGEVDGDAYFYWYLNEALVDSGLNIISPELNLETGPLNPTIALKVVEGGCSDSIRLPVAVNPTVEISTDKLEGCTPLDVQFNSGVSESVDKFFWSFGDEIDSTSLNPTFTFVNPDTTDQTFNVSLRVISAEGCESADTLDSMIRVHPEPTVDIDIDESVCYEGNEEIWYKGTSGPGDTFIWDLSDVPEKDIVQHPGSSSGPLQIKLTESPAADIGLQLVSEFGCKSDTVVKTFKMKPLLDISADTTQGCTPLNIQFNSTVSGGMDKFYWSYGDAVDSTDANPVFTFVNPDSTDQTFSVSLRVVSAVGCESTDTLENMIRVHPEPTVDISIDESVCYQGNEEIWYNGTTDPGDTFNWDLSDVSPGDIVQHPGVTAGPLQLNLSESPVADIGLQVVSEYGCSSDTLFKTFKTKPSFGITADTIAGCPPLNIELSLAGAGFTDQVEYVWDLGNGQTAGGTSVSQVYSGESRHYDVAVYGASSLTGCADTLLLPGKVYVYPVPEATFTANPPSVLVTDSEIQFDNTSSGAVRYDWDFGDGSVGSPLKNPAHTYGDIGLFDVSLLAENEFGCMDTATAQVSVNFDKLFPPNAFSPNAAREEDREFRIYADGIVKDGYKLLIFNRWGEQIFTSHTPEDGWDGKMKNGSNAPSGTYFWILEYRDLLGEKHAQKGSLTLLY